jgi:hypothetical protein
MPESVTSDGFDVGVADVRWVGIDDPTGAQVVRLQALWEDYPIEFAWNSEGLPMEPFDVAV